ncbi:hypothetical protein GV055_03875 [Marinomonas mediterranea]|nr:hypothetical protein GV055_03875 [Marinomonas mediterranea]
MMKKVPFQAVAPILKHFELSDDVVETVDPALSPEQLVTHLLKLEANIDLANFWAHALPMRESIWWACIGVSKRTDVLKPLEKQVLDASLAWVKSPTEPLRRQIEVLIEKLPNESASKWLGMAVFWSGSGSIAPIDNPIVMPAEFLYAKAVGGAVNTAAALPEWDGYKMFYKDVFRSAMDLANGGTGTVEG